VRAEEIRRQEEKKQEIITAQKCSVNKFKSYTKSKAKKSTSTDKYVYHPPNPFVHEKPFLNEDEDPGTGRALNEI
jgi:hypothetical protein